MSQSLQRSIHVGNSLLGSTFSKVRPVFKFKGQLQADYFMDRVLQIVFPWHSGGKAKEIYKLLP